ncbi:hypothetical protein ACKW6Q_02970 [Chryseobacterium kwangjuense]|uniref:J domain-containing protein n=1 Tax=Chryseobacterium kwangjuense TaxID=267125 RepID=A0ABW9JY52_9FLAO
MYTSLQQIKEEFNIVSDEIEIIRDKINQIRIENHPDKNKGAFIDDISKQKYLNANNAIHYLEKIKTNQNLIVVEKMTDLIKTVTDLIPNTKNETLNNNLTQNINSSLSNLYTKGLFPKISFSSITAVVTFFFLFPNQIKDNPILDHYIDTKSPLLLSIWISLLIFSSFFWLFISGREERAKQLLSNLKIESVQNKIFEDFIQFHQNDYFSKDDLSHYIHYNLKYNKRQPQSSFLFPANSNIINGEIAQNICEIIINRALKNEVIDKVEIQNLSEKFQLKKYR